MSFANPLFLLGLFGAAVPIIIHLIHKRKPRKQAFAAMELLLRSIERVESRWRLPQRLAIVVDASLSMRARYGDTSAFERAIVAARNLVDRLGPEDQATLIVARARPEALVERPTADRNRLLEVLENLEPSYEAADLGPAVTLAAESLAPIDSAQPEAAPAPPVAAKVVVLSDLQQPAIQSPAILELPGTDRQAQLEVIDVLADQAAEQRRNLAITTLESAPVPGNVPRTMELRARVQSYTKESGKEAAPKEVTLRSAEGDLETGIVEVVDGTIVDKLLRHAFERAGHHPVELVLEADALAEDSIRYAEVDVRRQVQALIVDGAPSGVPKEDEIFYLERALAAGAADQPPPRVITADDLPRADLGAFDVVILAGVPAFAPSDGARLVDWVKRGGGLFITTSKDLDPELYNSELGPILPRPFRLFRTVDPTKGGLGASGVVSLAKPLTEHPVLDLFQGEAVQGLLSARTNGYLMLQPNGQRPFTTLLEYDDGQPALVEASTGQGRVMVLTTSIDRDLSDLAIRPGFLPLMRQTLLYLGHALAKPDLRKTLVGEVRELRVPSGVTSLRVIGPDGQETEVTSLGQESELARYNRNHAARTLSGRGLQRRRLGAPGQRKFCGQRRHQRVGPATAPPRRSDGDLAGHLQHRRPRGPVGVGQGPGFERRPQPRAVGDHLVDGDGGGLRAGEPAHRPTPRPLKRHRVPRQSCQKLTGSRPKVSLAAENAGQNEELRSCPTATRSSLLPSRPPPPWANNTS
jgi:hypothetical protein